MISENEKVLSVIVNRKLAEEIKRICDDYGLSVSGFGTKALEGFVKEYKIAESMRDRGDLTDELTVHDLPDVSTLEAQINTEPDPSTAPDWTKLFAKT